MISLTFQNVPTGNCPKLFYQVTIYIEYDLTVNTIRTIVGKYDFIDKEMVSEFLKVHL